FTTYYSGTSRLLLRDERRQSQATSGEYTEILRNSQLKNACPVLFSSDRATLIHFHKKIRSLYFLIAL
ncbi:MAG: hypothetical protein D3913_12335, partial [Candidatus Electrothrix sp. LOE1_4_5]|nr:hypothetical protein [Candidatus Electrothrix gigas]